MIDRTELLAESGHPVARSGVESRPLTQNGGLRVSRLPLARLG